MCMLRRAPTWTISMAVAIDFEIKFYVYSFSFSFSLNRNARRALQSDVCLWGLSVPFRSVFGQDENCTIQLRIAKGGS
jgi:hypothetical protein